MIGRLERLSRTTITDPSVLRHELAEARRRGYATYTLRAGPQYDQPRPEWNGHARVAVFLEVAGNGDYLLPWAGNLDIMTAAAAARAGEQLARMRKAAA